MENKEVATIQSTELAATVFDNFKSMDEMLQFGKKIAESRLSPLKTAEDVVAAMLMGKELGLGVMASVNNIYPINGRATSGIHIITALIIKAGVTFEVIRDYAPMFQAAILDKSSTPPTVTPTRLVFIDEKLYEGESRGKSIIDYKTSVKFTRKIKQEDGSYTTMCINGEFSYLDAVNADLIKKDNWKYVKVMTKNRAMAIGARLIADDVLLGLYETSELADEHNIKYKVTEDGIATVILSDTKQNPNVSDDTKKDTIEEATIESTTPSA